MDVAGGRGGDETQRLGRALAPDTLAVRGGFDPGLGDGTAPPIHMATTFVTPGDPQPGVPAYGRAGNPGFLPFERTMAELEGGVEAVAFNAGVAVTVAIFDEVPPGGVLVMPTDVYYGFRVYAEDVLKPRGVNVRYVDMTDLAALDSALGGAAFLWTETPTNPLLSVVDLTAAGDLAKRHGVPWACDNTFASPLLQHPLRHGAAASMHSATKSIGGHSDVIMGVAVCADGAFAARLRARRSQYGSQPNGFSCWLARRGLQTMPLRVRRQSASALEIAMRLSAHPAVERVYHPGLPGHPGHAIAARQMSGGFGGVLSFLVKGGAANAQRTIDALQVMVPATSLGSVETLIERRARWSGEIADPALLRCSVGIEDIEDLWRDLDRALTRSASA
ncbi:MAG: trans-sulfuration enzyme family protein [Thermomicrobiales bacterium]